MSGYAASNVTVVCLSLMSVAAIGSTFIEDAFFISLKGCTGSTFGLAPSDTMGKLGLASFWDKGSNSSFNLDDALDDQDAERVTGLLVERVLDPNQPGSVADELWRADVGAAWGAPLLATQLGADVLFSFAAPAGHSADDG